MTQERAPAVEEGPAERSALDAADSRWGSVRLFNLYRATLAGLFVVYGLFGIPAGSFGASDRPLFVLISFLYFTLSLLSSVTIRQREPALGTQVMAQVSADILAITLLMYASGGVNGGLGIMLVVAVAGGALLAEARVCMLFAALASIAVLFEQYLEWLRSGMLNADYRQAALLGIACFATAYVSLLLARRVRASERLAAERALDLADLVRLNEHIVQRLRSGIMALDDTGRLRLVNDAARRLLAIPAGSGEGDALQRAQPRVWRHHLEWRADPERSTFLFDEPDRGLQSFVSFAAIGGRPRHGTLVFVEDASVMAQRAQQLKLASLGRLTASIAHEVRNPLGAISHAAQLLAEEVDAGPEAAHLTRIIHDNSARVNTIIANILQLSRRERAVPERLELDAWVRGLAEDATAAWGLAPDRVEVVVRAPEPRVRVDPSQLRQVVWNLLENAVQHAGREARLRLEIGLTGEGRPYLDVADDGPGIAPEAAAHLFEPFFTTRAAGTGLGLYIARELCESNQAQLATRQVPDGSCFRITFAHPLRAEVPLA